MTEQEKRDQLMRREGFEAYYADEIKKGRVTGYLFDDKKQIAKERFPITTTRQRVVESAEKVRYRKGTNGRLEYARGANWYALLSAHATAAFQELVEKGFTEEVVE